MTESTISPTAAPPCPLCAASCSVPSSGAPPRSYYRCPVCALIFVAPGERPTAEEERAVYDLHENSPDDPGYRRFLARLCDPLLARLSPASQGLDFGCGPGPTLSVMLEEAGHCMTVFDPFYAPYPERLTRAYDVITATEVVEHLHAPGRVLHELVERLRPGGWLGIMTQRSDAVTDLSRWRYMRDPTHVSFFAERSFHYLAERYGLTVTFPRDDVVLLQRVS
ncbi:methyltransferase family protein [Chromohalobacter marismortui]|uniref:Methyltransferase family protein n=1 Tax=Chromohalobacter marismortui TaxID=42055 RepID=A0A4R7NRQ5_9GAMM|nr:MULTISPECIES: class I SAM-dependent methyltransferase [Chromohalobacter]MCI0511330.1 class I SAM-dependent methyltransferase [Chromohalobacter sp.]MCI0594058.1 class I SAM-dependent methyltransferase [Chromohalobacter sp.]TDU23653.1 methyltransferase family protein [Chromohalobacter marismortui]